MANRLPKLPLAGFGVVGFVGSDQDHGAVKEDIVVCGCASMLETALVNFLQRVKAE